MNKQGAHEVLTRVIRVRKQDSAFIYHLLESYEGIASYSTLDSPPGSSYCDLELSIPAGFAEDVERLLSELGDKVYERTDR